MTNRTRLGFLILSIILLLAACSSKPVRNTVDNGGRTSPQSTNRHQHYPLYSDDDRGPGRYGSAGEVFPRPADIEPQVAFWRKVYSKWGRAQVAVHDKVHMDIIYDVFELPGEISEGLSASQKDYLQERFYAWKSRLNAVEDKVAAGAALDADENELVQYVAQKTGHRNGIQGASERLRYQRGLKERFKRGLDIGRSYDSQFRQIFRNAGLPEDLAYLPHVESSFQYNAHSSAGALGIWQFTSGAAKIFMNGDSSAAARLDPIASTHGAARYLASAYDKLGSWPLAVTSYNHGIGGMQRARNIYGHDFMRIVKHYDHPQFGFASRNYYAEFLAARDIASDPQRYFTEESGDEHYLALPDPPVAAEAQPVYIPPESPEPSPAAPTEAEPVTRASLTAAPEPAPAELPAVAQPVMLAQASNTTEPVIAEAAPVEPIAQPAPIYQPEPTEDEAAEADATEANEESEPVAPAPRRIAKAPALAPKRAEPQALKAEPIKALAPAVLPVPGKVAMAPPAATLKKPGVAAVAVETKPTGKALAPVAAKKTTLADLPLAPKQAAAGKPAAAPQPGKPGGKLASATERPPSAKATPASSKPTVAKFTATKPDTKPKATAQHEAEKKPAEKIRIAKR